MYTADQSYYLTREGAVVTEGDVRAATLLVAAGCQIPADLAAQYGLGVAPAPAPEPEPKALPAAPQTRAVRGPRATK